jgi:ATP-dependent exoDNAse (exonuclease V) beta subunit
MSQSRSFTVEQRHAIERRRGPLALAANAGSGKTSVLVERYLRAVLEDGIAPGRILAITFTERAAGELRERVRLALVDAGRRQQARESAAAFVCTFHSFATRLLRAHAALAGRTQDFVIADEARAGALREGAFELALAGWLEQPAALELAASFGVFELRAAIESAYDGLRSRGERSPVLPPPALRHDAALAASALARAAVVATEELAGAPPTRTIERALERLERCRELVGEDGGAAATPARLAALALGNGSGALASAACGAYEAARLAFEEALADRLGAAAVGLLDELLRSFGERYDALKRARGVVDFDDLELDAGALLAGHEQIRAHWAGRFELLMVDELQDTNARQMAVLAALDRDNLFTVGDEFQSIYGFRHADVGLFRARRDELARSGAASVLSTNFRSLPPLLHAVNGVFAPRFGERFVPLLAGRHPGAAERGSPPIVELLLADSDGWEPYEERLGVELAPAPLWRRAEARLLAARIDRLIAGGEAAPEEVVLLFRSGSAIGVYEAALADLGHATLASTGGGFFARPEVIDLVTYVRALANPLDELALYGVLASPLCGCSSSELASLELRSRELGATVWEVLAAEPPDLVCASFAERFAAARRLAPERGLAEIVAGAVADHGYDLHLATLHSPERRIANVRKLERLARDWERSEGRDLRRFAHALELGRVGSLRETEAPPPTEGTGAIALMTIHSAKGLEFPVVCLADLGHQGVDAHTPALLLDGDRVGLRLPTLERRGIDTLAYARLRAERQEAACAEEQRVIYVAMTRARERLILSGAARFANWPAEGSAAINWLGPALVPELASRAASGGGVSVVRGAGDVAVALTLCTAELADTLLWPQAGSTGSATAPLAPAASEARSRLERALPDAASSAGAAGDAVAGASAGVAGDAVAGASAGAAGDAVAGASAGAAGDSVSGASAGVAGDAVAGASAGAASTLSYSAIADYERCAYRYHLQRVLGLPDVDVEGAGGERAAQRGVVVHALLEQFDFAAPHAPAASEVAAAAALAGVELDAGEDLGAVAALVAGFARSPLCARLAGARELRREEAFAFALDGGELLRGFLDAAAFERDGGLLIVDYKTDRIAPGADLAGLVERDYSLQRLVYALAGIAAGAADVEVAHCFLRRPETLVATRFRAAQRDRLEAELQARLEGLRAGRFEVSADPNRERCGGCPGRARLCSHGEEMTRRESPATVE